MKAASKWVATWRAKQKAKGLCPHCTRPIKPGAAECEVHWLYTQKRARNRVQEKINRVLKKLASEKAMELLT